MQKNFTEKSAQKEKFTKRKLGMIYKNKIMLCKCKNYQGDKLM